MTQSNPRVLVVDDDPMVLKATTRQLQKRKFNVVSKGSVPEACASLDAELFDAVVTDRDMPDGGGAVVCQKAIELGVPCVVYTGRAEGVGHPYVLMKPASEEQLSAVVWGLIHD